VIPSPSISSVPDSGEESTAERGDSQVEVARAQAGDMAAFEALVSRYERRLLRLAYRMLGNLAEAQDACQEVFVKFHKYIDSLDAQRDPSPWLHQVTLNVCRDLGRKRQMLRFVSIDAKPEVHMEDASSRDPLEELSRERRAQALHRALAELPAKERAALILRDVEGHSAAHAAKLLGSSEPTVRSQACRGRLRLKQILEGFS